VGEHGKLLNTNCRSAKLQTLLIARVTAAELVHKAPTVRSTTQHTARAINSWRRPNQNKTEREYVPPTPCPMQEMKAETRSCPKSHFSAIFVVVVVVVVW
jgi:hypothetical protein